MHSASQQTAFDIYRNLQTTGKSFSLSKSFAELIDLAISLISAGRQQEAVGILNQLKECVQQAKSVVDGRPEMLINHVMTVKVLQVENCELRLDLARFSGDDDAIRFCENELKDLDLYVESAAADLTH
jgi:hypothetical protein